MVFFEMASPPGLDVAYIGWGGRREDYGSRLGYDIKGQRCLNSSCTQQTATGVSQAGE